MPKDLLQREDVPAVEEIAGGEGVPAQMDATEFQLQVGPQVAFLNPLTHPWCQGVQGLSDKELVAAAQAAQGDVVNSTPEPEYIQAGAIFKPGQTPNPDDSLRLAQLHKAECKCVLR